MNWTPTSRCYVNPTRNTGFPTGREPYGNRAPVARPEPGIPGRAEQVVRGRESRPQGEGGQVDLDRNQGCTRCAKFRTLWHEATGEPDALKGARPVRRGPVGKGP